MDTGRRLYPRRIYRPAHQVDVIVRRKGIAGTMRILGQKGFRFQKRDHHKLTLVNDKKSSRVVLNIYSKLHQNQSDLSMAAVWDRAVEGQLKGLVRFIKAPSNEDCFSYLIQNAVCQQLLDSPKWLNDFKLLIQANPNLDWDHVMRTAREEKFDCATWFALKMLNNEWDTHIPDPVFAGLKKRIGHWRRRRLEKLSKTQKWFADQLSIVQRRQKYRQLLSDNILSQI